MSLFLISNSKSDDQHKKTKSKKVSFELFPKKELFATTGAPSDISLAVKQNSLWENNHWCAAADLTAQYLDRTSASGVEVAAEVCIDTTNGMKEDEQVVDGTSLHGEGCHDKDGVCRETGEVVKLTANRSDVMDQSGGRVDGGGVGDDSPHDNTNLMKGDSEEKAVVVTRDHNSCTSVSINSHPRECTGVNFEANDTQREPGVDKENMEQEAVAISDDAQANPVVVGSNDDASIMDMEIELPLMTGDHSEVTIEDMTNLDGSLKSETSFNAALHDNESAIVADILAELGVIIAREVSPRGCQGRRFQQQVKSKEIAVDSKVSLDINSAQETNFSVELPKSSEDSADGMSLSGETNSTVGNITDNNQKDIADSSLVKESSLMQRTVTLDSLEPRGDTTVTHSEPPKRKRGRPKKIKAEIHSQVQNKDSNMNADKDEDLQDQSKRMSLRRSPRNQHTQENKESGATSHCSTIGQSSSMNKIKLELEDGTNQSSVGSCQSPINHKSTKFNSKIYSQSASIQSKAPLCLSPRNHKLGVANLMSSPQDEGNKPTGALRRSPRNHASSLSTAVFSNVVSRSPKKEPTIKPKQDSTDSETDEKVDPRFKVFEFDDEPSIHPDIQSSSPGPRCSTPKSSSMLVPRCPSSQESLTLSDDMEATPPPQTISSPGWVDGTAKRLLAKGMLSKEYEKEKQKKAKEEYDLDSDRNAPAFEKDVNRCKTQGKKRERCRTASPIKYVRKKKKDMFNKKSDSVKPSKRKSSPKEKSGVRRNLRSSRDKKVNGPVKSTPKQSADLRYNLLFKTSTPQEQEEELMQAIMGISGDVDMEIPRCLQGDDSIFDENKDLTEDASTCLQPVSTVNDTSDSWMYYNHGNPELDSFSDDSDDDLFGPRQSRRPGAIHGPVPFAASQNLCEEFKEFCEKLSQESSQLSSSQSLIDEEAAALDSTLNAATLSPLFNVEESEVSLLSLGFLWYKTHRHKFSKVINICRPG